MEAGNININHLLLSDLRKICSSEEIKTDVSMYTACVCTGLRQLCQHYLRHNGHASIIGKIF